MVSSCAAFSASLSKKSELAFGDGAILNMREVVVNHKKSVAIGTAMTSSYLEMDLDQVSIH